MKKNFKSSEQALTIDLPQQQQAIIQTLSERYQHCMKCGSALGITRLSNEPRLACKSSSCDFVLWNNPTPVVSILVEKIEDDGSVPAHEQRGQFVLAHNVAWPSRMYSVITGFLEAYDTDMDTAAAREVKEELNLDAVCIHSIGNYISSRMNQVIMAYQIKATGDIQLNEELDDYHLVDNGCLLGWNSETGRSVGDFLQQRKDGLLHYRYF